MNKLINRKEKTPKQQLTKELSINPLFYFHNNKEKMQELEIILNKYNIKNSSKNKFLNFFKFS